MAEKEARKAARFFQLERVDDNVFRATDLAAFGADSQRAAYGGLIMSQALASAEFTMASDFKPHSVHSFFILNVDITLPVEYHVRLLRDGRSFQTRAVEAIQEGKVAFCLQASFHKIEADSCAHQSPHPTEIAAAADCIPFAQEINGMLAKMKEGEMHVNENSRRYLERYINFPWTRWFFEYRCTDTPSVFGIGSGGTKRFFWIKSIGSLPADERLHRWLALFASDALPCTIVVGPHSKNISPSMMFTLDHTMHFHSHDIPTEQWLLYEMESTIAAGGRGFVVGRVWRTDGKLLASFTQEIIIRTRDPVSRL